jgi:hypothetical protein
MLMKSMHRSFAVVALCALGAPLSAAPLQETLQETKQAREQDSPRTTTASSATVSASVDVFVGGEGGYPVYRIPSIVRLERGDVTPRLLAFAEARGSYADVDENDLVMRVSDDDGRTWQTQRVIAEISNRSLNNPTAVEVRTGAHAGRVKARCRYQDRSQCSSRALAASLRA